MQPILSKDSSNFPFHQMFDGFSRHFRHVIYAEKQDMMRGILGKCGGSKGKQKSRRACGLAGRELYFLSISRFYLQQKGSFLFEE